MTVSEITREDVFRLIDFMRQTDDALYEAVGRWDDCYKLGGFISIKAAVLVWGRIMETLGFPSASCTSGLPAPDWDEFLSTGDEGSGEDIMEYVMEAFDMGIADEDGLSKAGITIIHDILEPIDFHDFCEIVDDAMEDSEQLSDDEKLSRAVEMYKDECCTDIAIDFPDFYRSMIEFACEHEFYASDICYMKSRRIGRFEQAREQLKSKLPMELYEGISFLISSVFMPLYCYFPDLTHDGMNADGEYCHVHTLGSFLSNDEQISDIHKRPYADVAVALLDRLMTEAEALAPELLSDGVIPGGESSETLAVRKAASAA